MPFVLRNASNSEICVDTNTALVQLDTNTVLVPEEILRQYLLELFKKMICSKQHPNIASA